VRAPVLAVHSLSKSYGPRRALDAVSFTVRPGEVLGLIGANGAGKTTLFECLAGLLPADAGEVRGPGGRALAPSQRHGAMFYVPDGIAPWPDQPVCRVLLFFRDAWGLPPERVSAVVDALRLRPLLGATVRSLSKGERKRFLTSRLGKGPERKRLRSRCRLGRGGRLPSGPGRRQADRGALRCAHGGRTRRAGPVRLPWIASDVKEPMSHEVLTRCWTAVESRGDRSVPPPGVGMHSLTKLRH
jgi:ABC transporter family protein